MSTFESIVCALFMSAPGLFLALYRLGRIANALERLVRFIDTDGR